MCYADFFLIQFLYDLSAVFAVLAVEQNKPFIRRQVYLQTCRQDKILDNEYREQGSKSGNDIFHPGEKPRDTEGDHKRKNRDAEKAECVYPERQIPHEEPFTRQCNDKNEIDKPFNSRLLESAV